MLDQLGQFFSSKPMVRVALGAWIISLIVVMALVWFRPTWKTMDYIYPEATNHWWHGQGMYKDTKDEYQYPPQFAILYTPFWALGYSAPPPTAPDASIVAHEVTNESIYPLGNVAWRVFGFVLMMTALWRVCARFTFAQTRLLFPAVALLVLPSALDSGHNGQANLPIAALMLHAAVYLMESKWNRATVALCLAFAFKPIAIVMLLLVGACYWRQMLPRLAIGFGICLLLPFILFPFWLKDIGGFHYPISQYIAAADKMANCAQPDRNTFTDIHGAIWRLTLIANGKANAQAPEIFNYQIDRKVYLVIQALSALGTLALCWIAVHRWKEPGRSLIVYIMAGCYLMLFNPRNETNSFIVVTPGIALLGIVCLQHYGRLVFGFTLVAMTVAMTCNGWGKVLHPATDPWLKPIVCLTFLVMVCIELFRKPQAWGNDESPPGPLPTQVPASKRSTV